MSKRSKLTEEETHERLNELSGWELADGKLRRQFRFPDFVGAFSFMSALALVSERMDHHPEWSNVYNRVVIELSTHDVGGISALDFDWARRANELAAG